jgi:hypothetical protein
MEWQNMRKHRTELIVVLVSLFAFGVASADIQFSGVLDYNVTVTYIDSVSMTPPGSTFLTPDWRWDSLGTGIDTFVFAGVASWPETLRLYDHVNAIPLQTKIVHPKPDTWYRLCLGVVVAKAKFYGDYGGVQESRPSVELRRCLQISPSIVKGQMTIRLQPVGLGRTAVEIHDATGNVIRTLGCATGTDGAATATWDRTDDCGRLVSEGVYFCRYAAADVVAVRKVLVTH